jgi:signal transduction histidine kinase
MPQISEPPQQQPELLAVPIPDIVRFVRQLSHDLRNHLNAAELQSAYITEVATDAEIKDEMRRLRGMLSEMGASLQRLSTSLAQTKLTQLPYETSAFVEDLQQKIATQFPQESGALRWNVKSLGGRLQIDPQHLQQAFIEVFANAFQHGRGAGPIEVTAEVEDTDFVIKLREPKATFEGSTANWGREPFHKVAHGHYGLGLHRARSIIEAHDGRLSAHYDSASSCLISTVVLPLLAPE